MTKKVEEGDEYGHRPKTLSLSPYRNLVISALGEHDETIYRKYCTNDIAVAKSFADN